MGHRSGIGSGNRSGIGSGIARGRLSTRTVELISLHARALLLEISLYLNTVDGLNAIGCELML